MVNIFVVYKASLHHFTNNAVHYNVLCSLHLVGPLFIRLGVVSYRLIRLMRYSHKKLCLSGFSSRFAVMITNVWLTMNKCVTVIAYLHYIMHLD